MASRARLQDRLFSLLAEPEIEELWSRAERLLQARRVGQPAWLVIWFVHKTMLP